MNLDKLPPQNIEAEESLISALMLYPEHIDECAGILDHTDFYNAANSNIFRAIRFLNNKNETVDLISISEILKKKDLLNESGGTSNLVKIVENIPMTTDPVNTARIIKEKSILRQLIKASSKIIQRSYQDSEDINLTLDESQASIMSIGSDLNKKDFITMEELTNESIDRYEKQAEDAKNGIEKGLKTGYAFLDSLTGGLSGPNFIIIAARPAMGKTAMSLNLAMNMCKAGDRVAYFSMEMPRSQIDDRFLAMESGINTMKLSQGQAPEEDEWKRILEVSQSKSKWPLWVDDTGAMTVYELKRKMRKISNQVDIFFIDQLSFITGDKRKEKTTIATEACNELAHLKKELGKPIVLLAQLNRELERRSDKEPMLSDIKNTGSGEEDTDMVILMMRPEVYNPNDASLHGKTVINLAKNRNGATHRETGIIFDKRTTKFIDGFGG